MNWPRDKNGIYINHCPILIVRRCIQTYLYFKPQKHELLNKIGPPHLHSENFSCHSSSPPMNRYMTFESMLAQRGSLPASTYVFHVVGPTQSFAPTLSQAAIARPISFFTYSILKPG